MKKTKKLDLLYKLQKPACLKRAWKKLNKSNHSSHGLSTETIESFARNLDQNLAFIRRNLRRKAYRFSPVRGVVLEKEKFDGEIKKRGIRIPEIQDRVVQRALVHVLEPFLNEKYDLWNDASFAYLRNRDIRKALIRTLSLYKTGKAIVLKGDIKKFFDTVNRQQLLKKMIFPSLPDRSLNNLINQAVTQEVGNKDSISLDDWEELFPDSGIPQGGGLSPLFSNVYLSEFDHEMLSKGFGLVRYADDFIVMCRDQGEAERAHKTAKNILTKKLRLQLHEIGKGKSDIIKITQDCFEFLGVRFDGERLYPCAKSLTNLRKQIRIATEFNGTKNLRIVLNKLKHVVEGWISSYCYTSLDPHLHGVENYIKDCLGGCAKRMGWIKRAPRLSTEQFKFSGIPDLHEFLVRQRRNLSKGEAAIFSQYF